MGIEIRTEIYLGDCKEELKLLPADSVNLIWEFISGETNLFTAIVEPLGFKTKEKNNDFVRAYSQMISKFVKEFVEMFCRESGEIDWEKLVRFNSAQEKAV